MNKDAQVQESLVEQGKREEKEKSWEDERCDSDEDLWERSKVVYAAVVVVVVVIGVGVGVVKLS
jgi:hypothetical protein